MYDPTRDYNEHKDEYMEAITRVMERGDYINGKEVGELEEILAEDYGCKYCVTVSSGTDALLVSLLALDIGYGDEVITTPFTWISSSEVISLIGAKPVFVDIDENTFNINPDLIEEKINDKTKAILGVSMFGQMANYIKINQIAKKYGVPVIDDAAQSFGATLNGKMSPHYNRIMCTSFFPTKVLGGFGDGGAILTNDEMLGRKMRGLRNHGQTSVSTEVLTKNKFNHQYIGTNSRLDTIKASLLLIKLKYLPNSIERRREIAKYYNEKLDGYKSIQCPITNEGHVYANYTIVLRTKEIRDDIFNKMKDVGINLSIFYPKPLHLQSCFKYLGYSKNSFPIAKDICDRVISLPCYPELNGLEQDYIINHLLKYLNKYNHL